MTVRTSTTGVVRSCAYIKEDDIKLGVSVASRKLHPGVVDGLRCRFCLAFGCEERVDAKRKAPTLGQSWVAPFRCDNIKTHMKHI